MTRKRKLMLFALSPIAMLVLSVLTYVPQGNKPIGPYGNFLISEAHAWDYCNRACDGEQCYSFQSEWGCNEYGSWCEDGWDPDECNS